MELHERQQFELLLAHAVDRYVERLMHRCGGAAPARAALESDPEGEGVWLGQFVDAFFGDFLLDNTAGATFVLGSLERSRLNGVVDPGRIGDMLEAMARTAFGDVLAKKTAEALGQEEAFG